MSTTRIRIARLIAASALALGLGVLGAGPALADGQSGWAWSVPDSSTTAEDDAGDEDQAPKGQISAI